MKTVTPPEERPRSTTETHMPGNPKARKRLFVTAGIVCLAISLFTMLGKPAIERFLLSMEKEKALALLTRALALVILLLIPPGLVMLNMARKTLREGRFPPADAWVISDTVIHRGRRARMIAGAIIILGLALIALSVGAAYFACYILPANLMQHGCA